MRRTEGKVGEENLPPSGGSGGCGAPLPVYAGGWPWQGGGGGGTQIVHLWVVVPVPTLLRPALVDQSKHKLGHESFSTSLRL